MILPQYTPFSAEEVRFVLGMPRGSYARAVSAGELQRSVHFDERISVSTSMHSLVDIVRFDVLHEKQWGAPPLVDFFVRCDEWLDALCDLHEELADIEELIAGGNDTAIMRHLLPEGRQLTFSPELTTWSADLTILFDAVSSWSYCYRALSDVLIAEGCARGGANPNGWQYLAKQRPIPHLGRQ